MLRLADIMTRTLVTATPEMTLREAAEQFAAYHISGAPVVSEGTVVGVVSAADILNFAASARQADDAAAPEEVARDAPPATDPTPDSELAASYFTQLWSERSPAVPSPDALDGHRVEEIMTRSLVVLGPDDDMLAAASLMEQKGIHRVLVVENGKLVGIVSTIDIVRAVAERTTSPMKGANDGHTASVSEITGAKRKPRARDVRRR